MSAPECTKCGEAHQLGRSCLQAKRLTMLAQMGDAFEEQDKRIAELEAKSREITCVYCGYLYGPTPLGTQDKVLTEHIRVCEKHPLRAAEEHIAELEGWEREFDTYRRAWIRELGGKLVRKTHEIDALVLTTRRLKEDTRKEVLRDCSKSLTASVTRADVVALAEEWATQ